MYRLLALLFAALALTACDSDTGRMLAPRVAMRDVTLHDESSSAGIQLTSALGSGCLTVLDVSTTMSPVTVQPCTTGAANQAWGVPATGVTGLVHVGSNLCLDAWGGWGLIGTQAGTYPCVASAPNHQWTLSAAGELKGQNGYCATVGTGTTPTLTLQVCTGAANQKWTVGTTSTEPAPSTGTSSSGQLVSALGTGCLAITNTSAFQSPATVQACVTGAPNQSWAAPAVGTTGIVKLTTLNLCLDAWGGSGTVGTQEGSYSCEASAPNHQWTLSAAGELKGQNGYCATVGTGTTPTLTLQVCTGAANQKWTMGATTTAAPATPVTPTAGQVVSALGAGCLAVIDVSISKSPTTVQPCVTGATNQTWTTPAVGATGFVQIGNNLCLDAWGGWGLIGTQAGTYPCVASAPNHQWTLSAAGELKGQNGYCATVGTGTTPTLTLQVCTGAANQKWTVGATSTATPTVPPTPTPSAPTSPVAASPTPATVSPAQAPQVYLNTAMPAQTGRTLAVAAGGDLQAALDSARGGDVITLAPGATYTGNFVLRAKPATVQGAAAWIVLRSAGALPAEGTRLAPRAYTLPKLVSPNSIATIGTELGAHHYRLVGLEVTSNANVTYNSGGLVLFGSGGWDQTTLAEMASWLVLDRSYVHGHSALHLKRCVALNAASSAVIDSYVNECHAHGEDSQAIGGWNGTGPYKIVNNYLADAAEVIMFGGAAPTVPGVSAADVEIRRNQITNDPSYMHTWTVKTLVELKAARRVQIDANVLSNVWPDGQAGFAFNLKSSTSDGACPTCITKDVSITNNRITDASAGLSLAAADLGGAPTEFLTNVFVQNNSFTLGTRAGDYGVLLMIIGQGGGPVGTVVFDQNTASAPNKTLLMDLEPTRALTYTNNLLDRSEYGLFCSLGGNAAALQRCVQSYTWANNAIVNMASYPAYPTGTISLSAFTDFVISATGQRIGADLVAITAATADVAQ